MELILITVQKLKSFFLKSVYFRSFGFIIAGLTGFLFSLNSLLRTVDDYPKVTGTIIHSQIRWNEVPFDIKINDSWFSIYYKKKFPELLEKAIPGKSATLWYGENNIIEQLIVEDEIVYQYSKPTLVWIILMTFGLIMFFGNIYYIIKFPQHAKGKENS